MARRKKSKQEKVALTPEQELATAQANRVEAAERIGGMVDRLPTLFLVHANVRQLVYTPVVAEKLPRSYAAVAFEAVQEGMLFYEIARIAAFWDTARLDGHSIPKVLSLLACPGMEQAICEFHRAMHAEPTERELELEDPLVRDILAKSRRKNARRRAVWAVRRLRKVIAAAQMAESLEDLQQLQIHRHKHVAHNLTETREEKKGVVAKMQYGYEEEMFELTVALVDDLEGLVAGTGYDFETIAEHGDRCAAELWESSRFEIPD